MANETQPPIFHEEIAAEIVNARDALLEAWEMRDFKRFHHYILSLHVSDIALVLNEIRPDERVAFINKIRQKELVPDILLFSDDTIRLDILQKMPLKSVASYLEHLETDDRISLIEDFSPNLQGKLLSILAPKIRDALISGLQFAPETAGRLMRHEFISVAENWHVGNVIDYLRAHTGKLPDFHNIMLINKKFAPVGVLKLSKLLASKRDILLRDIMNEDIHAIDANMTEENVVQLFRKYGLVESPVISDKGVLLGTITIDDVIAIADEKAEEDLLNLVGVRGQDLHSTALTTARLRGSWLLVNLMTAIITSLFIGIFDVALEKLVVLAILMPIIASMGGNAGMQSLAVTIRALALGYLTPNICRRLIVKEIYVGFVNGAVFAILVACATYVWFAQFELSVLIAVAMIINLVVANFSGCVVPILLARYNYDPTNGAAVILTTITDIFGFCLFLGLATIFLL
ncbi:MAG: magnesium transporter [Alphaproteobacteria bacterium]|nr:magnesium transporter [Alphaproteobacteria bacterium]